MIGCSPYVPMFISKENIYEKTIDMMKILEVNIEDKEKKEMEKSDYYNKLWSDFIPLIKTEKWYNVRIGCENYTILAISNHKGFL